MDQLQSSSYSSNGEKKEITVLIIIIIIIIINIYTAQIPLEYVQMHVTNKYDTN